jgi:hypothetical protein
MANAIGEKCNVLCSFCRELALSVRRPRHGEAFTSTGGVGLIGRIGLICLIGMKQRDQAAQAAWSLGLFIKGFSLLGTSLSLSSLWLN